MDLFNQENPAEIIHSIKEIIHCPFCGSNYHESDIRIMGKVSRNYVMHLICGECGNNIMASLTYQGGGKAPFPEEVFDLIKKGPINNNEVMDFVKEIKDFEGDFRKIFGNKRVKK